MSYFVGIDWASEEHAVCMLDDGGRRETAQSFRVAHSAEGLDELISRLGKLGPADEIPVAIERPNGVLVDTLVAAGHPVVPVHPNTLHACRGRYSTTRSKSDPTDAYILADVLRTDGHRLRALMPDCDALRALRALVRARGDLVRQRVAATNQLRALLESFWPGAARLFCDIESDISLAFLERYPTPNSARRLGEKRMLGFLQRNAYPGRQAEKAPQLVAVLRAAPKAVAGPIEEETKGALVLTMVALLRALVPQIKALEKQIEAAVQELPAGQIVMSFPRAGRINAAQIIAEIGSDIAAYDTPEALAADAGVVPSPYESGKRANDARSRRSRGLAFFRYACKKPLRHAVTTWANNSRHESAWAADVYTRACARGAAHHHAVRILARAWLRVLWRCLLEQTPYDVASHRAANQPRLALLSGAPARCDLVAHPAS